MNNKSLLWLFAGILFMGISIPLIFEKVPPNSWYGFRTAKTFSSDQIWYAANQAAGYDLLWAGVAIMIAAIIMGLFFDRLGSTFVHTINIAVFFIVLIGALLHSFWNLNQL
jgi:uncharacterized membrane protein